MGVDFSKEPEPGQDALWVHNPNISTQKILLVPSWHSMNLRFIRQDLQKAMREGDILITESLTKSDSWSDGGKFLDALRAPISELKAKGIIREYPFDINGIAWTDYVKHLDPKSFEYLQKEIQPFLEGIELSNIHPDFVNYVLSIVAQAKSKRFFGIDRQIMRYYFLKDKPTVALETDKELIELGASKDAVAIAAQVAQNPLDVTSTAETFNELKKMVNDILTLSDESPKASHAKTLEDIEKLKNLLKISPQGPRQVMEDRNKLWLPKLLKIFNENPDKFIVVVVGAGHFPTNIGILKLLSDKGYTFKPFSTNMPVPAVTRVVKKTPQSEEQKKIALAEGKKEEIKKLQEEATKSVDIALNDRKAYPTKLPQVVESGQEPKEASSIRSELINAMVRIGRTGLFFSRLKKYINVRNQIYLDPDITDKSKALEVLQRNPQFSIEQLKQ